MARERLYGDLRGAMTAAEITQQDVARVLRRSLPYVSACFNGRKSWELSECYKVMDMLHLDKRGVYKYFPPGGVAQPEEQRIAASGLRIQA